MNWKWLPGMLSTKSVETSCATRGNGLQGWHQQFFEMLIGSWMLHVTKISIPGFSFGFLFRRSWKRNSIR